MAQGNSCEPHNIFFIQNTEARIIAFVNSAVVLFCSILTLFAILKFQCLRTKLNAIIASQAVNHVLIALLVPVFEVATISQPDRSGANFFCKCKHSAISFVLQCSILHQVAISSERYLAVMYPLQYILWFTTRALLTVLTCIWGVSCVLSIAQILFIDDLEDVHSVCIAPWEYIVIFVSPQYILVNTFMFYINFTILKEVRKQRKVDTVLQSIGNKTYPHNLKAVKLVMLTLVAFVCLWTPLVLYELLCGVEAVQCNRTVNSIVFTFCLLHPNANFFVYVVNNKDFKLTFAKIFHC